ncbi:hypothetical protein ACFV1W_22110 [Kitasatospora sp. NPDC059648]|uniref:hypothetical protein n=1 Tax=Kitasatospora sp. NPDC059648 TaxID=3346894 RepID=UPI0036A71CC8
MSREAGNPRLAGTTEAVLNVAVSNRCPPEPTNAVSLVAGGSPFHLPDATAEFGELVRRTHAAAIGTHRHALTAEPAVLPRRAMAEFLHGIEELILAEASPPGRGARPGG